MLIDCDTCAMRNIACSDCVVTMLLDGPNSLAATGPSAPVEFDDDEWQAMDVLAEAGLISPLRLVPLTGTATGLIAGAPVRTNPSKHGEKRSIA